MLLHLRIQNLATIEDLEIDFFDGFSIMTGETGAGKSIMIDGIQLLLIKGHLGHMGMHTPTHPHPQNHQESRRDNVAVIILALFSRRDLPRGPRSRKKTFCEK